jgi:hypothetical protein
MLETFLSGDSISKMIRLGRRAKRIGKQVFFRCDYCEVQMSDCRSEYNRKKNHFCSIPCHAEFRREKHAKRLRKGKSLKVQ